MAERTVVQETGADAPELSVVCDCGLGMTPIVQSDSDDPLVWEVVCDTCLHPIAYLLNRAPDTCPFHTPEPGPHHVGRCCYYNEKFDGGDDR